MHVAYKTRSSIFQYANIQLLSGLSERLKYVCFEILFCLKKKKKKTNKKPNKQPKQEKKKKEYRIKGKKHMKPNSRWY